MGLEIVQEGLLGLGEAQGFHPRQVFSGSNTSVGIHHWGDPQQIAIEAADRAARDDFCCSELPRQFR